MARKPPLHEAIVHGTFVGPELETHYRDGFSALGNGQVLRESEQCNFGGPVWVGRVPPAPYFCLRLQLLDPSALLWPMAFHSYVITAPNSCRAKSHGLQ